MSIYQLKERFQGILRPCVIWLASKEITANQVTLFAVFLSILGGGFIFMFPEQSWPFLFLPFLLFVRMALNAIDGMLAKEHHQMSPLGAVLNELGDVVSDTFLYIPFAFVAGINPYFIILIVILSIISEMAGVIGVQIGASRRYDGPMGKSDRAFVFGLVGLLVGFSSDLISYVSLDTLLMLINSLFGIVLVLLMFTIWNRVKKAVLEVNYDK